jgi:death on curing protein
LQSDKLADLFRPAASYAFGIVRNHPFVDGNKRTALAVSSGFLARNGWDLDAPKATLYQTFLHLAQGSSSEAELAAWFARHAVAL